jgi:hypothetical protein
VRAGRRYGAFVRRVAVLAALLASAAAGCGGGSDGDRDRPAPGARVTGVVDLDRPRAGAPDAGTAAGHGADGGVGTTAAAAFSFTGRVDPPDSRVRVSDGDVRQEPSGRFTVAVLSPARGSKDVRIDGTKPGHRPWRIDVRVVRGEPGRVTVPERDPTAPTAALVVRPGGDAPPVVRTSPSRQGERPEVLTLREPRVRVTGVARDAEGGTGRIRVSMTSTTRCGADVRRRTAYLPPPQIENVALPPGARAPAERQRTARLEVAAGRGCSVRGEVWAEATDAHGNQAVTRHAGFRYAP